MPPQFPLSQDRSGRRRSAPALLLRARSASALPAGFVLAIACGAVAACIGGGSAAGMSQPDGGSYLDVGPSRLDASSSGSNRTENRRRRGHQLERVAIHSEPDELARRMIASFDFEEQAFNPDPVPRFWTRAQHDPPFRHRPGFLPENAAEFDGGVSRSGTRSVVLPVSGGSASLRLDPGVVPVFPGADYAIIAYVRTENVRHSTARLVARFLDARGNPLDATERMAAAPGGSRPDWTPLRVELDGIDERAAFIQIDLELVQQTTSGSRLQVVHQDFNARAWFDDVSIYQIPRLDVRTNSPINVFRRPDRPTVEVSVLDMVPEPLTAELTVYDIDGNFVWSASHRVPSDGRTVRITPRLEDLGWYIADVRINAPSGSIARSTTQWVWLPGEDNPKPTARRENIAADLAKIGVIADDIPTDQIHLVPTMLASLPVGFVTLPMVQSRTSREDVAYRLDELRAALDRLSRQRQSATLVIPELPASLADTLNVDADDVLALAMLDDPSWNSFFEPFLDRFGQSVLRWQFGMTGSESAFWSGQIAPSLANLHRRLALLVPSPIVSIPWSAVHAGPSVETQTQDGRPIDVLHALTLDMPASLPAVSIGEALAGIDPRKEITLVLSLPEAEVFGDRHEVVQLARRFIEAWRFIDSPTASADDGTVSPRRRVRIAIGHPWGISRDKRPQPVPHAAYAALYNLANQLGERRIVGELPLSPGLRCYVIAGEGFGVDPNARGAIVAWNEAADPAVAFIDSYLGKGPFTRVDVFGNRSPVLAASPLGTPDGSESSLVGLPHQRIALDETPVFIEGVDPYVVLFAASARLEPPFIPAVLAEHRHILVLANPWPTRLSGRLRIAQPADEHTVQRWNITPTGLIDFSILPGQTLRMPVALSFGPGEEAGVRDLRLAIAPVAHEPYPPLRIDLPIEIGLRDIEFTPSVRIGPELTGPNVVVSATVTNRSAEPRTLIVSLVAPPEAGQATQQRAISDLAPGDSTVVQFKIQNGADVLRGKRVRLTLTNPSGPERLNRSVLVP